MMAYRDPAEARRAETALFVGLLPVAAAALDLPTGLYLGTALLGAALLMQSLCLSAHPFMGEDWRRFAYVAAASALSCLLKALVIWIDPSRAAGIQRALDLLPFCALFFHSYRAWDDDARAGLGFMPERLGPPAAGAALIILAGLVRGILADASLGIPGQALEAGRRILPGLSAFPLRFLGEPGGLLILMGFAAALARILRRGQGRRKG